MDEYHDSHIPEEMLERCALNRLIEAQLAPLEEHLLICPSCQVRLDAMDEYVQAMQMALTSARETPATRSSGGWAWHQPRFAVMWATTVAVLVIVLALPVRRNHNRPSEVTLIAPRGGDSLPIAHARAGTGLLLHIDLREIPSAASYRLEVVNATGGQVWHSTVQPDHERLVVAIPTPLTPGEYWVRLFDSSQPPVSLREYGLELK